MLNILAIHAAYYSSLNYMFAINLAILVYVLKLVSNFTNIIKTVVSYYRANVISKCFA